MSKYDLNKAQDYQRLTLGSAAGILQTLNLAGRDPAKWDLLEGSYNGVLFHIFKSKSEYEASLPQISDHGGRRKVKYVYPYRDGQTTDDLGRKASTFDIEVLFHGPRYMKGFNALMAELDKPTPGDMIHPVRGKIRCVPEDTAIIHKHDARQALELRVTFIEHNFTIGDPRDLKDTSVKGALTRALDAFSTINNVITNVIGTALFVKSLRTQLNQALTDYRNKFGVSLGAMNQIFNNRGSSDIPGLLPVSDGGLANADGTRTGNTFPTVTSPSDIISQAPVQTNVPTSIAVAQVTKQVITLRQDLEAIIVSIKGGANGQGALEFYDDILNLKGTAVLLQDVLEKGIASSRALVIDYAVPRDMSLREIAFANGLNVNRVTELDLLNPELDSTNLIFKGSNIKVPMS